MKKIIPALMLIFGISVLGGAIARIGIISWLYFQANGCIIIQEIKVKKKDQSPQDSGQQKQKRKVIINRTDY